MVQRAQLDIAVRGFPAIGDPEEHTRHSQPWKRPRLVLVFDTETRIDELQQLMFGCYRLYSDGACVREGLFYGDDLSESELAVLRHYVTTHDSGAVGRKVRRLELLTRKQFATLFFQWAYRGRCLVVGFNLPFDISRIARDAGKARGGRIGGGFSFDLFSYVDSEGVERSNNFRPRIGIKHMDSKRALKQFMARLEPDEEDRIPEGSETGEPKEGYIFRGHFLDLRTLTFALTNESHSLESACEAFAVEHGKQKVTKHGVITETYIDYNRRDVLASSELAVKLLAEFEKHPLTLQATKAYSPASLGKAYLRDMGIEPILARQPDFPRDVLGYATTAFFGGRTSAHIRKVIVPVVYTDFLSMYPTVNSLMGLWKFVTAQEIRVRRDCRAEIVDFLQRVTLDTLFVPGTWRRLTGFVRVIPDLDILPVRAQFSDASNDWQVSVNYLYTSEHDSCKEIWVSLPDVVASVILTGKVPNVIDAFMIEPLEVQNGLKTIKLRDEIEIDPARDDFFRRVIEERKRLTKREHLDELEKKRLELFLKVLANSASYGIYAQMDRQESDKPISFLCHGISEDPFTCRVAHPDKPGDFCFPPVASLITGAARLMLAMVERCVSDLDGTYAMEDTDSMAIVASKNGGLIECPGGQHRTESGKPAIKVLTWEQVKNISERFQALNPYDRDAIPKSVLKIEDDNFDPATKQQRQLYCYAISAKRYTLFILDESGEPVMLKGQRKDDPSRNWNNDKDRWSQHGLGHLINPTDLDLKKEDRDWIGQVWLSMVRRKLGKSAQKLPFEKLPAAGQMSVTSPTVLRAFESLNAGKTYLLRVKPFNFVLSAQVSAFGHPVDADPNKFHLIAPFNSDARKWLRMEWLDQHSGKRYRITADDALRTRKTVRVKTYGEVVLEYEFHPESKCADADGNVCSKGTIGLLQRRHVEIGLIRCIGKESNNLEDVEAGLVHSADSVYTEYPDPSRDEWTTKILPLLRSFTLGYLERVLPFSRRTLSDWRSGKSRPHRKHLDRIISALEKLELLPLTSSDTSEQGPHGNEDT